MATNNWDKFCLLLWKNWRIQWNKKLQLLYVIFLGSILFMAVLIILRILIKPNKIGSFVVYVPENIDSLESLRMLSEQKPMTRVTTISWQVAYAPKNVILDKIMAEVANKLKVKTVPIVDVDDLANYVLKSNAIAGVQFDRGLKSTTVYPKNLSYALRFPSEMRVSRNASTSGFMKLSTWETNHQFPRIEPGGPRNPTDNDGGAPPGYIMEGFIALQNAIAAAYITQAAGGNTVFQFPTIQMQRYPYPPSTVDEFLVGVEMLMPLICLFSFYFFFKYTVAHISEEKELQLKEVMNLMGVSNWLHWTAWFVKSALLVLCPISIMVFLLKVPIREGIPVLTHSNWSALLFYFFIFSVALITFAFLLCTIFTSSDTVVVLCGLILFLTYLPFGLNAIQYDNLSLTQKLAISMFLGSALAFGIKLTVRLEGAEEGLQWNNMWRPMNVDDDMHVGYTVMMLLIISVLHLILALYLEQIFPGDFGIPMKWYFPFTKEFWCGTGNYKGIEDSEEDNQNNDNTSDAFETEIIDKNVGVQIKNLRKKFGDKDAVRGLSMNLFQDEITVLLGHNGAGKTTTIAMLTGMVRPTGGTAIINGCDILKNIKGARSSLALCPQHNILFNDLTVKEHIIFYSRLKGVKRNKIRPEIEKYVKNFDLESKANVITTKLSGGLQRKLCVGVALCGGSKVVLLDEPSSGMDPAARRAMWNVLKAEKKDKTILLTTHLMEEADVLGDRIAIMSDGGLKCFGTSFFLKKKFGAGYHLICEKGRGCKSSDVTRLLAKYIPNITIESEVGSELTYKLSEDKIDVFEAMLSELEDSIKELKLSGYGVANTSLHEVFMAVGAEKFSKSQESLDIPHIRNNNNVTKDSSFEVSENDRLLKGWKLTWNQWRAMFTKKYLNSLRNWIFLVILNIMPIIFIVLTIFVFKSISGMEVLMPLKISLNAFRKTVTVLETSPDLSSDSTEHKIAEAYKNLFQQFDSGHSLETISEDFGNYIAECYSTSIVSTNSRYLIAATISKSNIIGWFNNQAFHTAPVSLNHIHNAIASAVLGPSFSITVTNHPLPYSADARFGQLENIYNLGFELALNICFVMTFMAAFYVIFCIRERVIRAKLLQFIGGVHMGIFWCASLIWDFLMMTITSLIIILTFICIQEPGWSSPAELGRLFLIFIVFQFSVLPFVYLFSFLYRYPIVGFTYLTNLFILTGLVIYIFLHVITLEIFGLKDVSEKITWFALLIPHFALAHSISNVNLVSETKRICDDYCTLLPLLCSKKDVFCTNLPKCCGGDYFDFESPGIAKDLVYMMSVGAAMIALIMIIELKLFRTSKCFDKVRCAALSERDIDEDVLNEKENVKNMSKQDLESHNLVLDQVSKYYKNFLAVNQISLAVRHSECFGLLGVNGAGKTSAFKMITSDVKITCGNIYVTGLDLRKKAPAAYKQIGYCPQFEAVIPDLTARETLRIFGWLRGIPDEKIENIIHELAVSLGFLKHIDKRVKRCSGGTKRKISIAVAMVGNPSVICLDEPSTGMDPGARRQLWAKICEVRDSGKTIILTSHSMEECEALCTRLAIMVNGEFKCVGSLQHLKNKFSKGIVLKIKLGKHAEENKMSDPTTSETINEVQERAMQQHIEKVKSFVESHFPEATVKEQYYSLLTFYIPLKGIRWSKIFGLMEKHKKQLNIEDYSISQTTLEEIFLDFAKEQRDK